MKLGPCRTADPADDRSNRSWKHRAKSLLLGFVVLCFGLAVLGFMFGEPRRDFGTLARLMTSPDPSVHGERFWGRAEVRVDGASLYDPSANLLCDVQSQHYQSGKNGGWKEDARTSLQTGTPTLTLEDGRTLPLLNLGVRLEPFAGNTPSSALEARYRATYPAFRGPRMFEQCLRSGPVFVDGCIQPRADGEVFTSCAGEPLVITQGPRRLRIAEYARHLAYVFGLATLILGGLIWFVAERLRGRSSEAGLSLAVGLAPRGLGGVQADDVKKRADLLKLAPLGLVPICFWALAAVTSIPASSGFLGLCAVAPIVVAIHAARRGGFIRRLLRAIVLRPTSPLAAAEGDLVELAVRVSTDAPLQRAPLSGELVAHASIQVWERVVRGSGRSSSVHFDYTYHGTVFGTELPIEDASGRGSLDLRDAILDFPARDTVAAAFDYPAELRASARLGAGDFLVRESVLRRGDPIFVMGPVRRSADPSTHGQFAYRAMPTKARVGPSDDDGTEHFPLFVHMGTERTILASLRRGIVRERIATVGLHVLSALAGAALVALAICCVL